MLATEQKLVFDAILHGVRIGRRVQTIGGYAGTGKTVLASALAAALPAFAVGAFTGKAAHVLQQKGVERAQTLHSLMYHVEEGFYKEKIRQPDGTFLEQIRVYVNYNKKSDIEVAGVIIDEASMLSSQLYDDLLSYGIPLICVGDHGQLPPVGDDPGLMADPEHKLETIHRNAGEIAHFGAHLRAGRWASKWQQVQGAGKAVKFVNPGGMIEHMQHTDQTLVAFNAKRVELNREFREVTMGEYDGMPLPGDRLICLRNSSSPKMFNGQQVTVERVHSESMMDVADQSGQLLTVDYDASTFNHCKPVFGYSPDDPIPFDFGYAITVHKSQGSEWATGLVVEQFCSHWDHARWAYTAATRFKERILWTNPKWK